LLVLFEGLLCFPVSAQICVLCCSKHKFVCCAVANIIWVQAMKPTAAFIMDLVLEFLSCAVVFPGHSDEGVQFICVFERFLSVF